MFLVNHNLYSPCAVDSCQHNRNSQIKDCDKLFRCQGNVIRRNHLPPCDVWILSILTKQSGTPRSRNSSKTQWGTAHKTALETSGNRILLTPKRCTSWVLRNGPQIDVPGEKGLLVTNLIKSVTNTVFLLFSFQC